MTTPTAAQRYLSYADLARRWNVTRKTAAAKVRQYRPTAILKFGPTLHRVALRGVLEIERSRSGCGSRDVEGI